MSSQKQIIQKILEASEHIAKSSRKGFGSFILVSDLFYVKRNKRIMKLSKLLKKIN